MLEHKALDLVIGAAQVTDETLGVAAELPAGR
jgi:hypothetical protein